METTEGDISGCLTASLSGLSTNMLQALLPHPHTQTHTYKELFTKEFGPPC